MSNFTIKYNFSMIDNMARPMRRMAQRAANSVKGMRGLGNAADHAQRGINRMGGAASGSSRKLRRMGNDATFAERRLHRLARRMRNMQTVRLGMGGALTGLGTGLVTRKIGSSILDYEGSMNTAMSKMVEGKGPGGFILKGYMPQVKTAESMKEAVKQSQVAMVRLRRETMRIAQNTAFSPADVGDATAELASAGMNPDKIKEMLEPVSRLAASSGLTMGFAADTVTNISNAFEIDLNELPGTVDILATAVNATNFKMQDLAYSMKYAGASSFSAGQDIIGITAALMAMAQVGEKGSSAGNSLARIFESLYKTSGPATKALKSIGLTQDSFLTKKGTAIPIVEMMEKLNKASDKFGYKKVQKVLQALFQARGGRGAKVLMRALKEMDEFEDYLRNNSKGRAALMEEAQMSGIYGAYHKMVSSIDESIIALGNGGLTEDLTTLAKAVKSLANDFSALSDPTKRWVGWALLVATAISAIIIPLGILVWSIGALIPIFALLFSPILLVVYALAALAAGLMYKYDISFDDIIQAANDLGYALTHPMEMLEKFANFSFRKIYEGVRGMFPESWLAPGRYTSSETNGVAGAVPYKKPGRPTLTNPSGFYNSPAFKLFERMANSLRSPDLLKPVPVTGDTLAKSEADKQMALTVKTDSHVKVDIPSSVTLKGVDGRTHGNIPIKGSAVSRGVTTPDAVGP